MAAKPCTCSAPWGRPGGTCYVCGGIVPPAPATTAASKPESRPRPGTGRATLEAPSGRRGTPPKPKPTIPGRRTHLHRCGHWCACYMSAPEVLRSTDCKRCRTEAFNRKAGRS